MKKNLQGILFTSMIAGLVWLSSCSNEERPFPVATSAFEVTSFAPEVNLPVKFGNKSLNAAFYVWDFGDGDTDSTNNISPEHVYNDPGNYTVKLRAYNEDNNFVESEKTISVGERFLTSALIINMSDEDSEGEPWTEKNGTNVIFEVGYQDAASIDDIAYVFIENLNGDSIDDPTTPIGISDQDFIPEDFLMSYNQFYVALTAVDTVADEAVFIDMAGIGFDPLMPSEDDTQFVTRVKEENGTGFIQIPFVVIGDFQFLLEFEVR